VLAILLAVDRRGFLLSRSSPRRLSFSTVTKEVTYARNRAKTGAAIAAKRTTKNAPGKRSPANKLRQVASLARRDHSGL
jgi:hypothetical protein